jgi:hypothetical protein
MVTPRVRRHSSGARAFHSASPLQSKQSSHSGRPRMRGSASGVAVPAGDLVAVLALRLGVARAAGDGVAVLGTAGVHRPEGRCGESHEQPRVLADRLGYALATPKASGDQVPGITTVGLRTRRADAGAAVAARLQQHPTRLVLGGVRLADLAGARGRPGRRGRPAAPGWRSRPRAGPPAPSPPVPQGRPAARAACRRPPDRTL